MSEHGNRKQAVARLQIVFSMITFGSIGVFVKNISLIPAEIALWRGVIAFAVLFIFLLASGKIAEIIKLKHKLWKLFLSGVAMGFNWILLFQAYNYTSVALSTLSYYFAPTLVIIASSILFKEKLNTKQIVCFLSSTLGLVLIIGVSGGGSSDMTGILFGLGAATLYATVILFNKATGEIDGITRTWLQFVSAVIVLLPYVYYTGGFHIMELENMGIINLLIIGIIHTGIIYYMYFSSLAYLKGQQVAILSYIDPLVAVLASVFILGEFITALQLLGGIIILIFALANEIKLKR
ncbi:MAG: DMT family transporter [Dehalobacterium sp.]|jgi:RarD protein